jgi:hypothetical protein
MALRDDLLPVFGDARQLIQDLGLRTHRLYFRTRTWTGGRAGKGDPTDVDVELLPRPKIRETESGYTVTGITPTYAGGGYTVDQLRILESPGVEKFYVVVKPNGESVECGLDSGHDAVDTGKNFNWSLRLVSLDDREPT